MNLADVIVVWIFFIIGMLSGVSLCRFHTLKGYRRAVGWDMLAFSLFFIPLIAWLYGFFGFFFKLSEAERKYLWAHIRRREYFVRLLVLSLFPLSVWLMTTWLVSLPFRGLVNLFDGQIIITFSLFFYMLITISIYPILCAGLFKMLANGVVEQEITQRNENVV